MKIFFKLFPPLFGILADIQMERKTSCKDFDSYRLRLFPREAFHVLPDALERCHL